MAESYSQEDLQNDIRLCFVDIWLQYIMFSMGSLPSYNEPANKKAKDYWKLVMKRNMEAVHYSGALAVLQNLADTLPDAEPPTATLAAASDQGLVERKKLNAARGALTDVPVLADLTKAALIEQVDGHVLSMLVVAGFVNLNDKKVELNKMNVFPIPDTDTGANMVICTKTPSRNLLLEPTKHIVAAAGNLAADVLLSGQGNSGTILSHFFITLAEQIQKVGKEACSIDEFAHVIGKVGHLINKAVPTPVEGTMISTARDGCATLAAGGPYPNLLRLLEVWSAVLNEEVLKTPEQLVVDGKKPLEGMKNPVFPDKNNVDSGAQGFVYMYVCMCNLRISAWEPNWCKCMLVSSYSYLSHTFSTATSVSGSKGCWMLPRGNLLPHSFLILRFSRQRRKMTLPTAPSWNWTTTIRWIASTNTAQRLWSC